MLDGWATGGSYGRAVRDAPPSLLEGWLAGMAGGLAGRDGLLDGWLEGWLYRWLSGALAGRGLAGRPKIWYRSVPGRLSPRLFSMKVTHFRHFLGPWCRTGARPALGPRLVSKRSLQGPPRTPFGPSLVPVWSPRDPPREPQGPPRDPQGPSREPLRTPFWFKFSPCLVPGWFPFRFLSRSPFRFPSRFPFRFPLRSPFRFPSWFH